ncbi:MAG: hypothetical protein JWQ71_2182 [Pedosphaera sp.]|nr:hypothetical protein [Pedosphaera sp.]
MLIHIIGASGSGTSTLGRALAVELEASHLETDDYFWLPTNPPFTSKRARSERLSLLLAEVRATQAAVVSGSLIGWGTKLENAFQLIVFLYLETSIRVERLRKRELERFGKADPAFLEWAAQYDEGPPEGRSLQMQRSWLAARSCPVIELHGDLSVAERMAAILKQVPNPSIERRPATSHHRL